jgi:hypothetical protein
MPHIQLVSPLQAQSTLTYFVDCRRVTRDDAHEHFLRYASAFHGVDADFAAGAFERAEQGEAIALMLLAPSGVQIGDTTRPQVKVEYAVQSYTRTGNAWHDVPPRGSEPFRYGTKFEAEQAMERAFPYAAQYQRAHPYQPPTVRVMRQITAA